MSFLSFRIVYVPNQFVEYEKLETKSSKCAGDRETLHLLITSSLIHFLGVSPNYYTET